MLSKSKGFQRNGNQHHAHVESAKRISMVLDFYDKCSLKEFSILFSSEMNLGPTQYLRLNIFDNS